MDFTELYKHTSALVRFSPGTQFILTAVADRLIVRQSNTFQITRSWLVDTDPATTTTLVAGPSKPRPSASEGWISHIAWSKDSEYVLAVCAKRGVVNVFSMRDEDWNARIEAGVEGLVKAEWAPDGRTVICFSEWGLRVTLWSLVSGSATYIQYPKYPDRGYAFRKDGRYFILAERHKAKDTIGVYDIAESFKLVRHFPLPTANLSNLSLSPTGNHLAVWESIMEYKLYILDLSGTQLGVFSPEKDPGLGIRTVAWHPSGSFLAVGGHDDKIHILTSLTWSAVASFDITPRIPTSASVWIEPPSWLESTHGRGFLPYERLSAPFPNLKMVRPDPQKPNPKSGAGHLEWNTTGTLLLVRLDSAPTAVHIFSFPAPNEPFSPKLRTVLIHHQPVLHARMNPLRSGSLALCCGNGAVYTWSNEWEGEAEDDNEMAECVGVPAKKFECRDVRWGPDGKVMVLLDRESFCCAFEVSEEE